MTKKAKTVFVCQECGYESPHWMGRCACGAWNSFIEESIRKSSDGDSRRRLSASPASSSASRPVPVSLPTVTSGKNTRIDTGIEELNRVLGGGLVAGSLTLIAGEPGIGKSTLIVQAAAAVSQACGNTLYVSGEESEEQIKMRADRVCKGDLSKLYILAETNMEAVLDAVDKIKPEFLVIDSIQTMYSEALESAPGSVSQVRACGAMLMNLGKGRGLPIFIVAHVTKSGELAGPKTVEHMVDTVMQFNGERDQDLRILRSLKNRFGTTSEIGAFEMREEGLVELKNPSESFLDGLKDGSAGSLATAVYEGTRPLLLEVQALTAPANVGFARRSSIGVENSRLNMIIAVLERKAGLSLISRDVYVNIVGGLRPEGTSTDLAVALAIWSAEKGVAVPPGTIAVGEIGLTGDLRPVRNAEKLAREAGRMGFENMMLPRRSMERLKPGADGMKLTGVGSVAEAIAFAGGVVK
ncbi:MAG TPA: DNA repair protein RadA [Bacillota bacterium]|nr:DNA repair protein RadA [Bacillota bacterium]